MGRGKEKNINHRPLIKALRKNIIKPQEKPLFWRNMDFYYKNSILIGECFITETTHFTHKVFVAEY